ncbi:MAG: ABC transporter substrate-binding protein [Deltaproteobacteria bacterium]|nr:MAG: ABC transporter substrate-binding protein [Deltaproteobacteria bacterium]TMB34188.1 MAG: ABC transporter substrate-binding protein [Deltaproteobacteria bacterium]
MTRKAISFLALVLVALPARDAMTADAPGKMTIAVPGIPPVFSGLFVYVAKEEGFFKDQGLDVEVRPFDSGASAAQAVVAGNVDLSLSPTAAIVRMISNAGVDLVGIYGQEHPDWLLASADGKSNKCADLKDQPVGVDSVGGARAAALAQFLRPCGLKVDQVKLVSLSSNVGAAMIAGQIKFGVLHTDDVPVLEEQMKRKLTIVSSIRDVDPHSHYNLLVTTRNNLKTRRDAYVRAVAGLMEAAKYIADPKNADRVAKIATVTGRTEKVAKEALRTFVQIDFWPARGDGLTRANLEKAVKTEQDLGGIKPGKEPVGYERLVDRSVSRDASSLASKGR